MKKIAAVLVGCLMAFTVLLSVGCVKKIDNSSKTVEVFVFKGGYGVEWLDAMEKAFEEKTDYDVVKKVQNTGDVIESMIKAGPKTTTDLFIVSGINTSWDSYVNLGNKAVAGYDCVLADLDDVYEAKVDGRDETIAEKMLPGWKESFYVETDNSASDHYYALPWATGLTTLFYNKDLYDQAGIEHEPRTTNELYENCETLLAKGTTPFIYSAPEAYWNPLFWTWWVQYDGLNGYENFFNCRISDTALPDAATAMQIFDQRGIYESLYTIESLIKPNTSKPDEDFIHNSVEAMDYTTAQARFFDKQAAMMPNGDWLENEMATQIAQGMKIGNILPMRMPIVSALSDKLSYWEEGKDVSYNEARTSVSADKLEQYDKNLRDLVDYVDGVTTTLPTYGSEADVQNDIKIVAESRAVQYTYGVQHTCVIPAYATAVEGAKEFLKFMASDEGLKIYAENTSGSLPPFRFDYENWEGYENMSGYSKKVKEIMEDIKVIPYEMKYKTGYIGYLTPIYSMKLDIKLGAKDSKERMTAAEIIEWEKNYYKTKIQRIMINADLI